VQPLAPQRFAIQVTVGRATHDKLRRAQDLLGHQVPAADLEQVLDRALDASIRQLEHAKFAATERPRRARTRSTEGKRHIPAHVKRTVHERDGGRCTFVGDSGRRCDERSDLQFDPVEPFARGGEATVDGIRLLCPAHNQLEADRIYGAGFMERKRSGARQRSSVPTAPTPP
jgi:5-methylcytosine-specific restriction endonuclease McrA